MTLTDTGPLVALLDKDDANHFACRKAAEQLPSGPLLTSWACIVEAMYLLGAVGSFAYQAELWRLQSTDRLVLYDLTIDEIRRMAGLMEKYHDTPMDLADASLVAMAENLSIRRIFTLDGDFRTYRLEDGSVLDIIP